MSNGAPFWIWVKKLPDEPKVRRTRLAGRLLELRGNRGERRLQIRGRRDRQALCQAPWGRAKDHGERQQPAREGYSTFAVYHYERFESVLHIDMM